MKLILTVFVFFVSAHLPCAVSMSEDEINGGVSDILLTPEQQDTLEALANQKDPNSPQFAVVRRQRSLWQNAQVPYILDSSLTSRARQAIQSAINEYATRTCVRFVPRTNERDYVRFYRGSGCFSYIGRIGGGQDISIGTNCASTGIVIHEMFHALGRWHEQSRPDRDQYVRINRENIRSGVESNFERVSNAFVTTQSVPYDIRSIMHYDAYAFSRNRQPTIVPVDPSVSLSSIGQRSGFTNFDLQHVNTLYCDDGTSQASWSQWGAWSACSRTCNQGTRTRTRTCVGGTNCPGSNIDTQVCNSNPCPTPASWSSWTAWSQCSVSCGGGRQQRSRRCVNGNNCVGRNSEFRDCNTGSCPQPASWSTWGTWSSCSATCQGGIRTRRRSCQNGNTCAGSGVMYQYCNSQISCTRTPNPNTGEWGEWSACTRECGGGRQFRTRQCGRPSCETQSRQCNTQDCNPEPELRGLQHRGCYYVSRFNRRLGLLEDLTPELTDDPITRTNPIRKCATAAEQYSYQFFGISIGYCISGSNTLRHYQYVRSEACRNGVGAYLSGYFIMDVYEIVNVQSFQDSIMIRNTTTTNSTVDDGDVPSQGNGATGTYHCSWLVLLVSILLTLFHGSRFVFHR